MTVSTEPLERKQPAFRVRNFEGRIRKSLIDKGRMEKYIETTLKIGFHSLHFEMKKTTLLLLILAVGFNCKKEPPVVPPPNVPKDPRTYTWTVDTIAYPGSSQTLMTRMWASGPDNVYIVGFNDRAFGKMFRYDGTQWADVRLNVSQGGTISPPVDELNAIYGFAPNNIYAVGERYGDPPLSRDSAVIIHYDGVQWREQAIQPQRGPRLQSLWGATPTDIWAAGTNTLLHYNGVQWNHFPIELPGQGIQFLSIAGLSQNDVYMIGSRRDATGDNDTVAYLLYRYNGHAWAVIDSSIQVLGIPQPRFGVILGAVGGTLYSVYQGVFEYNGATWQRVLVTPFPFGGIGGTSPDNVFVAGGQGQVYHFNSRDWYRYPQFQSSNIDFLSLWTNGETIFVVGTDGFRTFVAQGK